MAYEAELGELRTGFADFRAKDNAPPASARSDEPKPAKKAHLTKEEDSSSDTDDSDDDDDDDDASGPYDHAFAPLLAANASRSPAQVGRVES